jgi:hypothetical protein
MNPGTKNVLRVIKDIYSLFRKSSKRERVPQDVQISLGGPLPEIPETIGSSLAMHLRSINTVKLYFGGITTICKHIHKDGGNLVSLAGINEFYWH